MHIHSCVHILSFLHFYMIMPAPHRLPPPSSGVASQLPSISLHGVRSVGRRGEVGGASRGACGVPASASLERSKQARLPMLWH